MAMEEFVSLSMIAFFNSFYDLEEDNEELPPPPPENLKEVSGMKGTEKANCGVKEKQKERTCSND